MSPSKVDPTHLQDVKQDVQEQETGLEMEDFGKNPEKQDLHAAFADFSTRDEEWLADMNKRIRRKVDFHLLPWIVLMYLTNFLDRVYVDAKLGPKDDATPLTICVPEH